jgi:Fur family ferric uptake transcriptional regulator
MERITKQRMAILKCLSEQARPLCIKEILGYAASEIPGIHLSTVYRTLNKLIEEKKIIFVELPGEKSCYEIFKQEHHHYFLCDSCNKIYFVNRCPKGLLEILPEGFKLLGHSITLNGFCRECLE